MPNTNKETLTLAAIAVIIGTLGISSGHFENPDAHLRLSQAFSLVNNVSFQLSDGVGNILHGNIAENNKGDRYSVYAPGQIVLFSPGAVLAQEYAIPGIFHPHYVAELINSFLGVAIHLLTGIIVFFAASSIGRSRRDSIFIGLLFSVATFNLPSSRDGYEHAYEAIFITLAYTTAWLTEKQHDHIRIKNPKYMHLIAGLFLGFGILFRPTTILALPGLFIICGNRKTILKAALGVSPGIAVFAIYNQLRFGSPIETGYLHAWLAANSELEKSTVFSIRETFNHALALWLSSGKGMLLFSPILLSLLMTRRNYYGRNTRVLSAILATSVIYTFFYAANFAWHGSAWCWGPRYLAPITPLLILLLPTISFKNFAGRATLFLAILSTLIQIGAILVNYKRHLIETLLNTPDAFNDGRIFFDPNSSPLIAIPKNFMHLIERLNSTDPIYNFITPGPWKNEAKIVDIKTMLDTSLDLNVIDLWWLRIIHYPIPDTLKYYSFLAGFIAFIGFIITVRYIIKRAYN